MLTLQSRRYSNTYENPYYYAGTSERLSCGDRFNRLNGHYFHSPAPIMHADLPLHMNGIKFNRYYFGFDPNVQDREDESIQTIKDTLLNMFNTCTNDQCIFVTGYVNAEDFDHAGDEFIDTDIWTEYTGDGVKTLFFKCVDQTSLRESERQGRNIQQRIRVFKSKAKHIILMLTNYADTDQESETFLALGLVPVFFEDWKEKFTTEEMEYFRCLVNRSQVKRISNVKPTNLFAVLERLEKYGDLERQIRYKTLFQNLAESRVRVVEQEVQEYQHRAESALQQYDDALKRVNQYEIVINKYREGTSDLIDELQTVAKMKGVYDINRYNNNMIKIIFRAPLDYYDSDEAECALRGVRNETVKRFYDEIFIQQKYKLIVRVDAYFSFAHTESFQDFNSINESDLKDTNSTFNPHYQFYHCLGDYKPTLIKAMRDQDLTMFVNVALAAARSINFKDGAVMNRWTEYWANIFENENEYYLGMKCLEKDGQLYSLGQWLHNDFTEPDPEINVIEPRDI